MPTISSNARINIELTEEKKTGGGGYPRSKDFLGQAYKSGKTGGNSARKRMMQLTDHNYELDGKLTLGESKKLPRTKKLSPREMT